MTISIGSRSCSPPVSARSPRLLLPRGQNPSAPQAVPCRGYASLFRQYATRTSTPSPKCVLNKTLVHTGRLSDRPCIAASRSARQPRSKPLTASSAARTVCCTARVAVSAPPSSDLFGNVKQVIYDCSWMWAHFIILTQLFSGATPSAASLMASLALKAISANFYCRKNPF